jgi:hypothetical protein
LLTEYKIGVGKSAAAQRIAGGLLGHWACWTAAAVRTLETCKRYRGKDRVPRDLLTLAAQVTDCNAALFDAANGFAGCIAGIHEILRRQGLLGNLVCLDPRQRLSKGQLKEIDRVHASYPQLNDDAFVRENLASWLR